MAVWFLAFVALASAHSQTPPDDAEGLILGTVVDGVTGRPVAGALVRVGSGSVAPGSTFRRTLTDPEGRFVVFRLPPGRYSVLVDKDGYGPSSFGGRGPGARLVPQRLDIPDSAWQQRLTLRSGERRRDVLIRLWPFGAISGRVLDQQGTPLAGVHVQAWPRIVANNESRWSSILPLVGWTNDRGEYRLIHAVAREYLVAVPAVSLTVPREFPYDRSYAARNLPMIGVFGLHEPAASYQDLFPRSGRDNAVATGDWLESIVGRRPLASGTSAAPRGYATTFAPGTSSPDSATPVIVAPGIDARNTDVRLAVEPLYAVSGVLIGPGGPLAHTTVTLSTLAASARWHVAIAVSREDGSFRLAAVPSGQYVAEAFVWPQRGLGGTSSNHAPSSVSIARFSADPFSDKPTLWARRNVAVGDADLKDVRLTLQTGARLSGRLEFRGEAPIPTELRRVLALDRPDGWDLELRGRPELGVAEDRAFTSIGLPAGQYLIRAPEPPAGWTLLAVTHGGRDISVDPLDLGSTSIDDITVIFTDDPSRVSGSVSGTTTVPASAATVVAFPREERSWRPLGTYPRRMQATRVDTEGRFALVGLPPGDYIVAAIDEAEMVDWPSRELLSVLARAGRHVRIEATTKMDLTLRMVPVR